MILSLFYDLRVTFRPPCAGFFFYCYTTPMRILAIDPGYERMGIAVLTKQAHGGETVLDSACFRTSSKLLFQERILLLGQEVGAWIERWKPSALAIETLFFNTNQKTAMRVSEARGAVIYEARRNGVLIFEYTPLQVKIAITGDGRAEKARVVVMLKKLVVMKKKIQYDDEYDAIAIGLAHLASKSFPQ